MKREWLAVLSALQFLTRLPVPDPGWEEGRLDRAAKWFPLAGAVVGAVCAAVFIVAKLCGLELVPALVLAIGSGVLVTGALHEDGLADTADGLGGGQTRARRLAIMKDSTIGTYGALALIISFALRVSFYGDIFASDIIRTAGPVFIAAHMISRGAMLVIIWSLPYARDADSAKVPPLTGQAGTFSIAVAFLSIALPLVAGAITFGADTVFAAVAATVIATLFLRRLFRKKLGGWTGDTAGAVQQATEIAFLLGLSAWI